MLKKLCLKGVGEFPELDVSFGRRFNVFTGENGLGKTFLLDIIWYALTRKWPWEVNPQLMCGYKAIPSKVARESSIEFVLETASGRPAKSYKTVFNRKQQSWVGKSGRPCNAGLVVYAQADGGFCVWDPARNYWLNKGGIDVQDREPAFVFSPYEVWNGQYKFADSQNSLKTRCTLQGLLADWLLWQSNPDSVEFPVFVELLKKISPPEFELAVGTPISDSLDDVREVPSIKMPYGDISVKCSSSAVRRILAVAYMLVWSFSQHVKAAKLLKVSPSRQITLIFDELDAHLHPKWQRQIIGALIAASEGMMKSFVKAKGYKCAVQVMASTHSPLVMSSLEDDYDPKLDNWLDFNFDEKKRISVNTPGFAPQGTADNWYKSEAFDLTSTYSPGISALIERIERVLDSGESVSENAEFRNDVLKLRERLPLCDEHLLRLDAVLHPFVPNGGDDDSRAR